MLLCGEGLPYVGVAPFPHLTHMGFNMFRKQGRMWVAYYRERGRDLIDVYASKWSAAVNARPGDIITKIVGPYPGEGWRELAWIIEPSGGLRLTRGEGRR